MFINKKVFLPTDLQKEKKIIFSYSENKNLKKRLMKIFKKFDFNLN